MKILGIIVEYNPFHNGHLYHLEKSKEITGADFCVGVMSGNYVQRGEPACIDKFTRAKMALSCGVDVIIELPTPFASSSAEFFAQGAIKILDSINIVTDICFGAETNNLDFLSKIADVLVNESQSFSYNLQNALCEGNSYPRARNIALEKHFKLDKFKDLLNSSNNILAIEYLKALKKMQSSITPHLIQRLHVDYNSDNIIENITSATNIRNLTKLGDFEVLKTIMPKASYDLFIDELSKNNGLRELNDFSDFLQYKLKTISKSELVNISGMNEGIENRLLRCANESYYITDILTKMKTKRYTHTALQRLILHTVLGIGKDCLDNKLYARILGFRSESKHLLKLITENSKIPVVTNVNDFIKKNDLSSCLQDEIIWTDIYNLVSKNLDLRYSGQELTNGMIVV